MKELIDRNSLVTRLVATCCLACEDSAKCNGCNVMDMIATVRDMPILDERPSIGDKVWRYRIEGYRSAYDWKGVVKVQKTSHYVTSWRDMLRHKFDYNMKLVIASERCDSDSRRYSEVYHRSLESALEFIRKYLPDVEPVIRDEVEHGNSE